MSLERKFKEREARDIPGHAHLLTFSTRKKKPYLLDERICLWLCRAISREKEVQNFHVLAYVFMPDHVHLLIRPLEEDYQISKILKAIKQGVSRKAMNLKLVEDGLWERGGGHDRNIASGHVRLNAIRYIHLNPVRKELCEDIMEYRWSSARALHLGEPGEIQIDGSW